MHNIRVQVLPPVQPRGAQTNVFLITNRPEEYFVFYVDFCTSANAALEIESRGEQNERGGECGQMQMHSRVYQ